MRLNDDMRGMMGRLAVRVSRRGNLIDAWESQNLIVDGAREVMAALIAGAGAPISYIGFGDNGTSPDSADTSLTSMYNRPIAEISHPSPGVVSFAFNLNPGEANGLTIREFGLITSEGVLFARKTRGGAGIEKTADISLSGTWTITF
jgi:hypothetical protein